MHVVYWVCKWIFIISTYKNWSIYFNSKNVSNLLQISFYCSLALLRNPESLFENEDRVLLDAKRYRKIKLNTYYFSNKEERKF